MTMTKERSKVKKHFKEEIYHHCETLDVWTLYNCREVIREFIEESGARIVSRGHFIEGEKVYRAYCIKSDKFTLFFTNERKSVDVKPSELGIDFKVNPEANISKLKTLIKDFNILSLYKEKGVLGTYHNFIEELRKLKVDFYTFKDLIESLYMLQEDGSLKW